MATAKPLTPQILQIANVKNLFGAITMTNTFQF